MIKKVNPAPQKATAVKPWMNGKIKPEGQYTKATGVNPAPACRCGVNKRMGMAFIVALAIMVILFTLGAAYLLITRTESEITSNQINAVKAFYAADAGVEHAIARLIDNLEKGIAISGFTISEDLGDSSYSVTYSSDSNMIISNGVADGASRVLEVEIIFVIANKVLQSFGSIKFNNSTGTIDGNIEYGSSCELSYMAHIGDIYTTSPGETIPTLILNSYSLTADHTIVGDFNFTAGTYSGVYYIQGEANIGNDVVINGTVWATEGITIKNVGDNVTISPSENNPALISESEITLNNIESSESNPSIIDGLIYAKGKVDINNVEWLNTADLVSTNNAVSLNNVEDISITGLVYAYDRIDLNNIENSYITGLVYLRTGMIAMNNLEDMSITGALLSSSGIEGNNLEDFSFKYDANSLPSSSYSSAAMGVAVVSWQGHPSD